MDCYEGMKHIPDKSIDLVLTDPNYDKTQNDWDTPINIELFWKETKRVLKERGCIILTAVQPFTSDMIVSNRSMFRYDLVWEKNRGTDFLNAQKKPINVHESILIFYSSFPSYTPQKTQSKPYKSWNKKESVAKQTNYGKMRTNVSESKDGKRYPLSVLYFKKVERAIHPTQKPLKLFEWLINSYSNESDVVLDPFLGSGTTALACLRLQRDFIAFELKEKYCKIAESRIKLFREEQKRLDSFVVKKKETLEDFIQEVI